MNRNRKIILVIIIAVVALIAIRSLTLMWGSQLYDSTACWRCDELLKMDAIRLREALSSVGRGDIASRETVALNITACAKGIYLSKKETGCTEICPAHPNTCWVIRAESACDDTVDEGCVDINGDFDITSDFSIGTAYSFESSVTLKVEKTGPTEITLTNV